MSVPLTFRPLVSWPDEFTKHRAKALFKVTYSKTREDLDGELRAISARNVRIYLDVMEAQIRQDGLLRADAKPGHPGVMITFTIPGQNADELTEMHCDTYDNWHHNLRGIALSLEALRGVARWGTTKRNQQYSGFKLAKMSAPAQPLAKASSPSVTDLFGSVTEAVSFLAFVAESSQWTVDTSNTLALERAIQFAYQAAKSPAQLALVEAAIAVIRNR